MSPQHLSGMKTIRRLRPFFCVLLFPALLIFNPGTARAVAGELNLQAQLVWGTDDIKPKDPDLKDLDPKLKKKLKDVFKWKNYYECRRQTFVVPASSTKRVQMSSKCQIQVENLADSRIEVKLYGEGNLLVTKKQNITPGELLVLAGDDKNNTAWFVVVSLITPHR